VLGRRGSGRGDGAGGLDARPTERGESGGGRPRGSTRNRGGVRLNRVIAADNGAAMSTRQAGEDCTSCLCPRLAHDDEEVVRRVVAGGAALFEVLMRRYNQRRYRVAGSIVRDESEAEDVMQQAYVNAYSHLAQFAGRAKFATWLTRIAVHEALARTRRRARSRGIDPMLDEDEDRSGGPAEERPGPEEQAHTA